MIFTEYYIAILYLVGFSAVRNIIVWDKILTENFLNWLFETDSSVYVRKQKTLIKIFYF